MTGFHRPQGLLLPTQTPLALQGSQPPLPSAVAPRRTAQPRSLQIRRRKCAAHLPSSFSTGASRSSSSVSRSGLRSTSKGELKSLRASPFWPLLLSRLLGVEAEGH